MDKISHYINEINEIRHSMHTFLDSEAEIDVRYEFILLDDDEILDMLECMDQYITDHPKIISDPDFDDIFLEDMQTFFPCCENIEEVIELFHILVLPKRSQEEGEKEGEQEGEKERKVIKDKIERLHSHPQHAQRTPEWYDFRNNLITASNAYKIFETNATRNQLIYEKCSAYESSHKEASSSSSSINIESSLHWGQKYEPVSVLIYEKMAKTKIEEFGCIKHAVYSFLGASPDGIITNPSSSKYGRMLEIKNIVNREIDGIPKKEYWIQMQLQMEVCDLDTCDFLETQFIEYETEADFLNDYEIDEVEDSTRFLQTSNGELKGIIMYFSKEGMPSYIYKPLDMNMQEFDAFECRTIEDMEATGMTWIKNIYWRLKTYSCVLVKRNRRWFEDNVSDIEDLWNVIKRERKDGYSHRAPIKRRLIQTPPHPIQIQNQCLISIQDGKTIVQYNIFGESCEKANIV